jgi:predicted regulator of amino acid metabolism with ACT domain
VWPRVKEQFSRQIVRPDIVRKMIECGIRVSDDDKIFVDDVEVDYSAVARAVDVDRRVVKQTDEQIRGNRYLYSIFSKTKPLGVLRANHRGGPKISGSDCRSGRDSGKAWDGGEAGLGG